MNRMLEHMNKYEESQRVEEARWLLALTEKELSKLNRERQELISDVAFLTKYINENNKEEL